MNSFIQYLEEAQQAVEKKYGQRVEFYWGEYSPDITNFYYHYLFASAENAYKVTVNTFDNGNDHKFLIRPWPFTFTEYLKPISLPVGLSLMDAYERAKHKNYNPNLYEAVAFLENEINSKLGPGYWFLSSNDKDWIFVSTQDEHNIVITQRQPFAV